MITNLPASGDYAMAIRPIGFYGGVLVLMKADDDDEISELEEPDSSTYSFRMVVAMIPQLNAAKIGLFLYKNYMELWNTLNKTMI